MKKRLLAGLLCLMCAGTSFAATYIPWNSGNWSVLSTWADNGGGSWVASTVLPTAADSVILNGGLTVSLNTNSTITNLTVTSGSTGTLNVNTAGQTLTVNGTTTVNSNGTINITAGTNSFGTMTAARTIMDVAAGGLVNVAGGTLAYNLNNTGVNTTINGAGTISMSSGAISFTGGAPGSTMSLYPKMVISGGRFTHYGQFYGRGEFQIVGTASTNSFWLLNSQPGTVFKFVLGTNGVSKISVTGWSFVAANGKLVVDGTNYTGAANEITLFSLGSQQDSFAPANITVSNFPSWATTSVVQGGGVIKLVITGDKPVPEVPPAPVIVWENDMSVDPVGNGWVTRAGSHTMDGGLMTMSAGNIIDTTPFDNFMGFTKVDLVWRATSYSTSESALGAGVWCNVNNDAPTYGAINIHSVLLSNNTQTVKIYGNYNSELLVTIPGFSTNMLTLSAVIDSLNSTIAYQVTDGVTTNSGATAYPALSVGAGVTIGATLFNLSPVATAEVDYVRVEANARPAPGAGFMLAPNPVSISLLAPAPLATGTVSVIYGSATNVVITSITVGSQSHAGSLAAVTAAPLTISNASVHTKSLAFAFDNDVAALEYGSATGLVTVVWTEAGSGVTNNLTIPISASIILQSDVVNAWSAGGNGVSWGDAANWNLGRIPGVYAADQGIIQGNVTVAVTTNFTGAFPYSVTVRGNSTAPTLNISANLQGMAYMWLGRDSGYWGFVNQTAGAVTSGDLKVGDAAGAATTDSLYTLSGGTHTVSTNVTVYSKGEMDVTGGTLAMNKALEVTAGGLVKLTAGTLTVDADNNDVNVKMVGIITPGVLEISGGTFNQRNGRVEGNGTLRIVGDAATVTVKELWAGYSGTVEFILDATGVSTISNSSWGHLNNANFRIDGANYIGPTNSILLYTGFANAGPLGTDYAVTNLGVEGVDWTLTEVNGSVAFNGSARQTVTLNILTSHEPIGYAPWAAGYGLSEVPPTVDVDGDGLINLMEYALGGDPTADDAAAVSPVSFTAADSGTNWFYYVHNQRTDDPALIYTLGTETDLVNTPAWNTNDVVVVGESAAVSNYKSVTNRTATVDSAKFLKLTVEQP